MSGTNVFQYLFGLVDKASSHYINNGSQNIIEYITPIFNTAAILLVVIWGYRVLFGQSNDILTEGIFKTMKIMFILLIALTIGNYQDIVINVLKNTPVELAKILSSSLGISSNYGSDGGIASSLDTSFDRLFLLVKTAWNKAGVFDGNVGFYIMGLILLLGGGFLLLYIAFYSVMSLLMTSVLLALGPLFIIAVLFNTTQRFFESWLGLVLNFGLVLILSTSMGMLILSFAEKAMMNMSANPSGETLTDKALSASMTLGNISVVAVIFGFSILIMKQVPSASAALGGGVALGLSGAVKDLKNGLNTINPKKQVSDATEQVRKGSESLINTVNAPKRGFDAARSAYQKKFGSGISKA